MIYNKENFVDIPGYQGKYAISKNGNIYSYKSKRLISPVLDNYGYYGVNLYGNGDGTHVHERVHRLLAETFIPNPDNKPTVDHINRDRTDNRLENLRWATVTEQNHNQNNQIHNTLA